MRSLRAMTDLCSFVGMRSEVNAGGFVENFSDRFTLSGMTGTFPAEVKKGFSDIIGTSGPATRSKIHVEIRAAADPDAAGAGAFGIPYSEQTGPTRYAPMQSIPPTSITATNTAPLFPTSSVDILSVAMGTATIQTTVTQPQTFSVASHANQVHYSLYIGKPCSDILHRLLQHLNLRVTWRSF